MAILINTQAVSTATTNIDTLNKKIRDDLTLVDNKINKLPSSCEGEAVSTCIGKYKYIKEIHSTDRYAVLNEMVSFMRSQIGENYEEAEKVVSKAAVSFK